MALKGAPTTQGLGEAVSEVHQEPERQGARGRALFFGAIGAVATAYLVTHAEMVVSSIRIGYLQFPPAALAILLLSVAIGRILRAFSRRWSLSSSDLLVIYSMSLVAAMVSSHGVVQKIIPALQAPGYFASNSNNWHGLFHPYIQQRLVPWDRVSGEKGLVLNAFYAKLGVGESIPWRAWVTPLLNWGILVVLVLFAFLCLTALLRKQWVDNEKLSFPLAQLPMEIAGDGETLSFFRNRLMWMGVLIPVVIYGMNGLHQIIPTIPDIKISYTLSDYYNLPPVNGFAGSVYFIFSFAAIGFFFLLPTDVLFSIWFFYVLTRVEQVLAATYNMDTPAMPLYPPPLFIGYQTVGAYLVLVFYFFWIARPHLAEVWSAAIGKKKIDDSQELLPYRFAFWGLVLSIVCSSLWLWGMGMSLWLAVGEMVVFLLVIAVVMARSTAEAGMLMTETTFRPIDLYRMVAPIHALGPANLTILSFFDNMFLRDQRGLLLTGMLDSMRMSDGAKVRRRSFVGVLAIGIVLALIIATGLNIYLPYKIGGTSMDWWMMQGSPQISFNDYAAYFKPGVTEQPGVSWQMPLFFGVGTVMTIFLTIMRANFFWWPLHPLGYALSGSWSTVQFWFPCLVAWILKSLAVRYGGMSFYVKARPFFLGLVLGEFGIAVIFVILNALFHITAPSFPWG